MKRSKLIFLIAMLIFFVLVLFFAYDFMRKTSPPWEEQDKVLKKYDKE